MTATHFESLRTGAAWYAGYNTSELAGIETDQAIYYAYGAIVGADRDGLVQSVNPADGATLTFRTTVSGMTNASGVVTFDTPRNVTIYSATDEHTKSILLTGTDFYGAAMSEAVAGPTGNGSVKISEGNKAFKTISSAVCTGDFGTIEVGFGSKIGLPFRVPQKNRVIPIINGELAAPHYLTSTITAIGTAQDTAVLDTIGGTIVEATGVSAAANGTASSTVTITNPSALQGSTTVGTIVFTSSYAALAAQVAAATLIGVKIPADGVLKVATDGTGDGAGQATITIQVDPAVITVADDTTATTTTGDVRGTIDFGLIPNGTKLFSVVLPAITRTTKDLAFGVTQA